MLPGIRVSETFAKDVNDAIKKLEAKGFTVTGLRRQLWASLVDLADKDVMPAVPLRIMTEDDARQINQD